MQNKSDMNCVWKSIQFQLSTSQWKIVKKKKNVGYTTLSPPLPKNRNKIKNKAISSSKNIE